MMRQRPVIEALEPRILYLADLAPVLAPAVTGPALTEQRVIDSSLEFAAQNDQAVQSASQEIVFIDSRTPDYAQIVDDIAAQSSRHIDVVMLDANRDGLTQISEALAGRENVAALHIIGHGGDGVVQLGNRQITSDSLQSDPGQVQSWSQALTADADILLYGCDVAATAQGRLLADTLARLTGADVSASDDATGHASLGGDWTLEYATGNIEAAVAPSLAAQDAWLHLLPSVLLESYEPPFANMTDFAYDVSGGDSVSQSFSHTSGGGTYTVDQIDLVLYKIDNPAGGNVTVEIRNGLGGGSTVLADGTIARKSLAATEGWVSISLTTLVPLPAFTDGTTYYINIKGTGPAGVLFVGVDDAGTYGGAAFSFFDNSVAQTGKDMAFRLFSNPAPVVDLNGPGTTAATIGQDNTATTAEQTSVLIASSGATLTDANSVNLTALTVTLTARPDGDAVESLSLNATALAAINTWNTANPLSPINFSYTASTGTLSITGTASLASSTYQTILRGIQYNNTSDAPSYLIERLITVVATDDGVPANSSVPRTSFVTITPVNDAPVNTVPVAQATNEDTALVFSSGTGNLIAIVDDSDLNTVRVTLTGTNGVITLAGIAGLTFSSGANGTAAMTFTGTVTAINTALNGMSFLPGANFNGAASLSIATNDQGGTGSGIAQSDSDTVNITVNAVNDAPVLTPAAPLFTGITEDQTTNGGQTVASLLGASMSDVDAGAVEGIAITGVVSGNGSWEYSTDGGTIWVGVGAVADNSALLLRDSDLLRFVPDGQNADAGSVTYRAWDRTSGTQGTNVDASTVGGTTAFSTATDTASITVTAVNDAPVLTPAAPLFTGITEDQTTNGGQTVASLLGASMSDVDAGAVEGIAITGVVSGNGSWEYSTDGGTIWVGVGAVADNSALLLRDSDLLRFVPDGQNADAGSVTYRAWDRTSGTQGTNVDASTVGGTTAFSTATDTASITVTAVNDAPVLTPAAPLFTGITEDQTTNGGQTVASLLGASMSDVDAGAVEGIAITGVVSGNGSWEYSTDGGTIWVGVGAVADNSALLLRDSDLLRFVPDGQNADAGSVTYRAWDRASGTQGTKVDASTVGGTTAFSTATDTASITVTAVNDAPVLTPAAPLFTGITEDQTTNGGQTVASLLGASMSDVDAGAVEGIAITGVVSGNGSWEYSTDGGTIWVGVGAVADNSALLLRDSDLLRFVPDGQNADAGSVTYRAWDRASGTQGTKVDASTVGGTTAFSTATDTASITVTAVNDAPVLTPAAPLFTGITEDQTTNGGQTVASLLGASMSDVDAGAVEGIAITGVVSGNGSWEYSTDGGTIWVGVGAVADNSALLLRDSDLLRFVPDGQNADAASVTYRAWDRTSGTQGTNVDASTVGGTTAFSTATDTASITVTAVNDAPVLTPAAPLFTGITEDQTTNGGQTVASLLGASMSDVDAGAVEGIAITGVVSGNGSWEYSTDGGTIWVGVGAVADNSALLLRDSDLLRFVPDGQNADAGSVTYRAWDRASGTQGTKVDASTVGGTTAFSTATDTASITVTAVNDAPVLSGTNNLAAIGEDPVVNGGTLVSALIAGQVSDVDTGALAGIAVTAVDNSNGSWEYSTDGGGSWSAFGSPSSAAARLLAADATSYVRFVPNADFNGTVSNGINFRAWDLTSGSAGGTANTSPNGGVTAFSSVTASAAITVAAVNDAPVNSVPGAQTTAEDTALVFSLAGGNAISIGDVDAGAGDVQVLLTATNGVINLAGTGGLIFTAGADGTASMTFRGTVAAINAALDGLSFQPGTNFSGAASLSIITSDQGNTGAGGTLSDVDAVAITVLPNVAPTVTASGGITFFTEGANVVSTPVVLDGAVTVSDPDSTMLASATISIGAGWQAAEDVLGFIANPLAMGNIAGGYNAATGVLTLNSAGATATLAQWQAALRTVTYTNTSDTPNTTTRTVSFVVDGFGGISAASTQSVAVTAVNDTPVVTASAGTTNYFVAAVPVVVDGGAVVADVDNAALAAAAVSISAGFNPAEDVLAFAGNPATMGNIAGSYNAASGTLSLTSAGATATLAQWQTALRSVTYTNASAAPINGTRTVSFELSDGTASSPVVTHALAVSVIPLVDLFPPSTSPQQPAAPGPTVVVTPPTVSNPPQQTPLAATSSRPVAPAGGTLLPIDAIFLTPVVNSPFFVSTGGSMQVLASNAGLPESRLQTYGNVEPVAEVLREFLADAIKQIEVRPLDLFQLGEQQGRSAGAVGLGVDLARLQDSLREQDEIQTRTVVTLTAGSLSMTLVYLIWLVRGGALAASMLAALPAWRLLDPLPILARVDDEDDEIGEEDEQAIASFYEMPVGAKRT